MVNQSYEYCVSVPEILNDAFDKVLEEKLIAGLLVKLNLISEGHEPVRLMEYKMDYGNYPCSSKKAKMVIGYDKPEVDVTVVRFKLEDLQNCNCLAFGTCLINGFVPRFR